MSRFEDRRDVTRAFENRHISREAFSHFEREAHLAHGDDEFGVRSLNRALNDATFNRGPLAGKTGDPFKDDPFFNPWAKGGAFNKDQ